MSASGSRGPDPTEGPRFTSVPLDRRRFLIVAAGASAYVVLRPYGAWAKKLRAPLPPLQPWALPDQAPADELERARALIGAAILAPSHWNSQPWRFEVEGTLIRLLADSRRALPMVDPDQRAMRLSLGAALENLLVAGRAWGLRPTVTYRPPDDPGAVVADVGWTANGGPRDRALFAAITTRRTHRDEYDGRGLFRENRAALNAQIPGEFRLRWIDDRRTIRAVAELARDAVEEQVLDRRAQAECFTWMRFGDEQARQRADGITVESLDLGGPAKWLAGHYFHPRGWLLGQGAGSMAKKVRDGVRTAGALALLTAPPRREDLWVAAGQAYERFALKATQLGIAQQPLDAPISVTRHRAALVRHFGAAGEEPLMFVRLGHAKRPRPSRRRGVALVASFRKA